MSRKWLMRVSAGAVVLPFGGLVWAWLAAQFIPAWYVPARVAPQDVQAVKDDLADAFAAFSEQVNRNRPFQIDLSQDQVNRWLAVRDEFGPQIGAYFPDWLSDPMVIIQPDKIGVAGTVSADGMRSVVSLWFELELQHDHVAVTLTDVRGGSLPVPRNVARSRARAWLAESRNGKEGGDGSQLRLIEQLLAGRRFDNRFAWENGKREFRLLGLEMVEGAVRLRAQAYPDAGGSEWSWKDQASGDWLGRRTSR